MLKTRTSILNEKQVVEIRREYARGERQTKLADRFGVSQAAISYIVRGNTWADVPDDWSDEL